MQNIIRYNKPFKHIIVAKFLSENRFKQLLNALKKQPMKHIESDLFSFDQTNDLMHVEDTIIKSFHDYLSSKEIKLFVEKLFEVKLKNKIDMFGAKYSKTNYLLPHDDKLEGRKVAYIFYLTSLSKKDGGTLDFFNSRNNRPVKVTKSYTPVKNSLVLFEVTPKSFHQVSEIITNTERYTLSGWFYV